MACPKCGVQVPVPEAQRNAPKVLLKCQSCEHMFVWKREEATVDPSPSVAVDPPSVIPAVAPEIPPQHPIPVKAVESVTAAATPAPEAQMKVRWTPPPSSDFVVVVRDWGTDKADRAKHLAAKLLMESGLGRQTYEFYRKQLDVVPFVQKKIPRDLYAALSKLLRENGAWIEADATPLMLCPYHPNEIRKGNCSQCGKPLCAICLKEEPVCRECRDRESQAARRSVDEQRAKVKLVTSAALLGDHSVLQVLGFVSAETLCDEHAVFDSLSKSAKGVGNTALDQAKDQVISRLQLQALQMGATAIADFRIDISHFQSEALGKCFAIIQASGTAVVRQSDPSTS